MATINSFLSGCNVALSTDRRNPLHPTLINFKFPTRKTAALVGCNGTGKTTLIRAILGEPVLKSGVITFFENRTIHTLPQKEFPELVAYLPQEQPFLSHIAVRSFLELAFLPTMSVLGRLSSAQTDTISYYLHRWRLASLEKHLMGRISSGERQKIFLLRAFLQGAKCLVLDEPTNHLDPYGKSEFWALIEKLNHDDRIEILVTSHDLDHIQKHSQWVLALDKQGVAFEGSTRDFFDSNQSKKVFGLL